MALAVCSERLAVERLSFGVLRWSLGKTSEAGALLPPAASAFFSLLGVRNGVRWGRYGFFPSASHLFLGSASSFEPMPTTLPPSVQETLGEQAATDLARWLDEYVQENAVERDEYREVLSGLDVLEEGFSHMEKRFDLMAEHVDDRLDDMKTHVDGRLDEMETRFEQIDERFKQVDERFERLETRMDERFEEQSRQFNERIDAVNERIDGVHDRLDERLGGMDAKLEQMNDRILSMTRWLIGLVALFGSLVTALLAVAQIG